MQWHDGTIVSCTCCWHLWVGAPNSTEVQNHGRLASALLVPVVFSKVQFFNKWPCASALQLQRRPPPSLHPDKDSADYDVRWLQAGGPRQGRGLGAIRSQ